MNRKLNALLLCRVAEQKPISPTSDLVAEHTALVRWLGQLQRRIATLQQEHHQQVTALQTDLMRLREQTMVLRTATLWGLGATVLARPGNAAHAPSLQGLQPLWREASEVICQTGCVGHAHPWRDDQGLCRRTGQPCQPSGGANADAPDGCQIEPRNA